MSSKENTAPTSELRVIEKFLHNLHAGSAPNEQVQSALHYLIRRALAEEYPNDVSKHPRIPDHPRH